LDVAIVHMAASTVQIPNNVGTSKLFLFE